MLNEYAFATGVSLDAEKLRNDKQKMNVAVEAETIRRAQRGDAGAFERLYRTYSTRVFGLCLRMVRNAAEAEDLTQEAFLLVFRKLKTFRGASAFSTWLYRLAVNVVLASRRRKRLPLEDTDAANGAPDDRVGDASLSPAGMVDRLNLKRAVVRLTPSCRMVFVLHDIHGFKHCEIAGMMDCSIGASKSQLHRARRLLRKLLLGNSKHCAGVQGNMGRGNEPGFSF